MSNQVLTAASPLWKQGNKGNIEFLSSFKRLERESPDVYKQIEQREGFTAQIDDFEYHVGRNQYGLWLSRRRLGLEGLHNIEKDDRPPARPPMTEVTESKSDKVAMALMEIANSLKLVALSNIATTEEERNSLKARLWNE